MQRALVTANPLIDYSSYTSKLQNIGSKLQQFNPHLAKPRKSYISVTTSGPQAKPMDWKPTKALKVKPWPNNCGCKGEKHTCGRKHAKWIARKVLDYRRNHGLCLRCGNQGHLVRDCKFLAPVRQQQPAQARKAADITIDPKRACAEEPDKEDVPEQEKTQE